MNLITLCRNSLRLAVGFLQRLFEKDPDLSVVTM